MHKPLYMRPCLSVCLSACPTFLNSPCCHRVSERKASHRVGIDGLYKIANGICCMFACAHTESYMCFFIYTTCVSIKMHSYNYVIQDMKLFLLYCEMFYVTRVPFYLPTHFHLIRDHLSEPYVHRNFVHLHSPVSCRWRTICICWTIYPTIHSFHTNILKYYITVHLMPLCCISTVLFPKQRCTIML